MRKQKSPKALSRLISYILGRHPDEFGLVPSAEGYVRIKDLLKAIHEEDGWKYVRKQHLIEILYTLSPPPVEIKGSDIRATNREHAPIKTLAEAPPKLLYTCVRRKAYPAIVNKGVLSSVHAPLMLSADRAMAERIGRRSDAAPVLLTVQVQKSLEQGVTFYRYGDAIFLSESIPADCFSGPPLSKQKPESVPKPKEAEREVPRHPGSYFVDLTEDKMAKDPSGRRKKQKKGSWKRDRKKLNRQKDKMWPL